MPLHGVGKDVARIKATELRQMHEPAKTYRDHRDFHGAYTWAYMGLHGPTLPAVVQCALHRDMQQHTYVIVFNSIQYPDLS